MKNKILLLLLILIFSVIVVNGQNPVIKTNPVGSWTFEAPNAPEGYTAGSVIISFADKKYTAKMGFATSEDRINGENVKFENDTLSFSVYIQGQDVAVKLIMNEASKMSGKAVYSEGEVPLTLVKTAIGVKSNTK